ncbi:pikachurin [Trichonephila clavata]|uniref:Pikachurin n=1 Tax=Trichonephila clavata TaxID=2740835 RepID=A0A8X6LPM0_TRICU|nr:pikachurin [Trichonephila clavata]
MNRSKEPLAVGMWHSVFISRTGRDGILEVDNQPKVEGISPGAFTQLSLPLNMYIGGVHDARDVARKASITESFTGCIQKVTGIEELFLIVQNIFLLYSITIHISI